MAKLLGGRDERVCLWLQVHGGGDVDALRLVAGALGTDAHARRSLLARRCHRRAAPHPRCALPPRPVPCHRPRKPCLAALGCPPPGLTSVGALLCAGLLTYPRNYTRIVLQQLRPAGFAIRLATLGQLSELLELEVHWGNDALASDEATLRRRIEAHPTGQLVAVTAEGELLGAIYTQRVASYEALLR